MTEPFRDDLLAERALEQPSGYQQAMHYRLSEWQDGHAVVVMEIEPQHMNRRGVVHGGVLSSLVDTAGGFAATWSEEPGAHPGAATLTLTTSFVAPATVGPLRAVGTRRGGGRTIAFVAAEIFDGNGTRVAFGEATYRILGAKPKG